MRDENKKGCTKFFVQPFLFVVYVLRKSGDDGLIIYIHTFGSRNAR